LPFFCSSVVINDWFTVAVDVVGVVVDVFVDVVVVDLIV